ncbi:MAG: DoxX family protein [Candidatus Nanoarchaeia archaeon]
MDPEEIVHVSSVFLRLGLGITFLYMGFLKALSPTAQETWGSLLNAVPGVNNAGVILLNFILYTELIVGALLLLGLFTRYAAGVATLLLVINIFFLNWYLPAELLGPWGPFAIKDIGLLAASITSMFMGAPLWSLDGYFEY